MKRLNETTTAVPTGTSGGQFAANTGAAGVFAPPPAAAKVDSRIDLTSGAGAPIRFASALARNLATSDTGFTSIEVAVNGSDYLVQASVDADSRWTVAIHDADGEEVDRMEYCPDRTDAWPVFEGACRAVRSMSEHATGLRKP